MEVDLVISFGRRSVQLLKDAFKFLNEKSNASFQELGEKAYLKKKLENTEVWLYEQHTQLSRIRKSNNMQSSAEHSENIDDIITMIGDGNDIDVDDDGDNDNFVNHVEQTS